MEPRIPDRYTIVSKLGAGGMGAVYKVHDKSLDKEFALKVLRISTGAEGAVVRFQKEAKAAGKLLHENIVKVIDFGYYENTTPYMVLEFVEGQTLKDSLQEHGVYLEADAIPLFEQIAAALAYAHQQGIVHRDLKSSNILLNPGKDGTITAKLFDFGIAQILESRQGMSLTATNAIIGTPSYMSPEQAAGKKADARSDIYSFGCVMFETLTGELPFKSDNTVDVLSMHISQEAPAISSLQEEYKGAALEQIIQKCLKKNPSERFQSAKELLDQLAKLTSDGHEQENAVIPVAAKRNTSMNIGIALASAVIVVATTYLAINRKAEPEPPVTPNPQDEQVRVVSAWSDYDKPKDEQTLIVSGTGLLDTTLDPNFTEADLDGLRERPEIEELSIALSTLSEDGMAKIGRINSLENLNLQESTITATGIKSLANLPVLNTLNLRSTKLKKGALSNLSLLKKLKLLYVNSLTKQDFEDLSLNTQLENINIKSTRLTKQSFQCLSKMNSLRSLSFTDCSTSDGSSLSLLSTLKLRTLMIKNSHSLMEEGGLQALTEFSRVCELFLESMGLYNSDVAVLAKGKFNNLYELSLRDNPNLTKQILSDLGKIKSLRKLKLHECPLIKKSDEHLLRALNRDCEVQVDEPFEGVTD